MIYRDFQGMKLPLLGIGTMRLPLIDGKNASIDIPQTERMLAYAMEHGVNYFDTAWGYHDCASEPVVGEILSTYPRDGFYLASKFPGYDLANMDKVEEIFEQQLERCKVDYFDFYLIHNVCELNIDHYLDEKHGILAYLLKQKEGGRIRHLGFSAHGGYEVLRRFLEAYGEHMEFCQLQINWLDWTFQKANEKARLMEEYGIPLWVMEPLRGGSLATLPEADAAKLKALRPEESIPGWAFRFLQTLLNVAVILGGMSSFEQMEENIATFAEEKPLNAEEMAALQGIADSMAQKTSLPCTACRYCTEYCPQGLDIPHLIGLYNQRQLTGQGDFIAPMALAALPEEKQPQSCIGCKSCVAVCPQQLPIASAMENFAKAMASQ